MQSEDLKGRRVIERLRYGCEDNIKIDYTQTGYDLDSLRPEQRTQPKGRAMAQVVSRRSLTAEAWVRARINPCGICGGQSGTGIGFSPSSSVFPCQYHSTVAHQSHIIWGMLNMLT
jgi:hypothetical protein